MAQTIQESDLGNGTQQQAGQQAGQGQGAGSNQAQGAGQQNVSNQASASGFQPNSNQQKGSGYTNIQKLVNANQSNQLGNAIGQGIQNVGQQVQGNLNQAQQNFQQQTGQNQFNTQANQQLVQNVLQDPTKYVASGSNVGNPQAASTFQNLISGVYQGPSGLSNASQLQNQAQDVSNLNKATSNAGGRVGLLQRFVGNPQYGQGEQNLDSLLLGQTGQKQLNQARQATAGLGNQVNSAITGAQAQGQQQTNLANQFGKQVQNQFGQTVTGINQDLQSKAQQAQQQRDAQVAAIQQAANQGTLTQSLANQLGITGPGTYNYGAQVGNFITEDPLKASAQNIANAQNYAQINALRQLAGQSSPQSAQQILGQFANQESQAGKFTGTQGYDVNQQGFQSALNSGQQQYQNDLAAQQAAVNNFNSFNNTGVNMVTGDTNASNFQGYNSPNFTDLGRSRINAIADAKARALAQLGQQLNITPDNSGNENS